MALTAAEAAALRAAAEAAIAWRAGLEARPVGPRVGYAEARAAFGGPVPERPGDPEAVVAALIAAAEPGLTGAPHPRFHGWVTGASHPVGVAADWLGLGGAAGAGGLTPAGAPRGRPAAGAAGGGGAAASGWVAALRARRGPGVGVGFGGGRVCREAPEEAAASSGAFSSVRRFGPASRARGRQRPPLTRPLTPIRIAAGGPR